MNRRRVSVMLLFSILQFAMPVETFDVIGSKRPIIVTVDDDAVLPCHVEPGTSLEDLEVRWFRSDFTSPVHLYANKQDRPNLQDKAYRERTELFNREFPRGNASLRLKKVKASDEGNYTCFIDFKSSYEEAVINLKIGGIGQQPWIHLEGTSSQGVRLACKSNGWYPEPTVQWLDGNRRVVNAKPETTHQKDSNGLFTVLTRIDVTSDSVNRFSCLMQNSLLHKEEEARLRIPEIFFPKINVWLIVFWVFVAVVITVIVLDVMFHRKKRKRIKELQLFCILEGYKNYNIDYPSVTLVKKTGHQEVEVSGDLKSVKWTGTNQPDAEKRLKDPSYVLGKEGFTSGRHYWEVEVIGTGEWNLGAVAESVNWEEQIKLKPENGFWTIGWLENHLVVNNSADPQLSLGDVPKKIGVYLNYESQTVSFFNADTKSHLYTFPRKEFPPKLYPILQTSENAQLKICPTSKKRLWLVQLFLTVKGSTDFSQKMILTKLVEVVPIGRRVKNTGTPIEGDYEIYQGRTEEIFSLQRVVGIRNALPDRVKSSLDSLTEKKPGTLEMEQQQKEISQIREETCQKMRTSNDINTLPLEGDMKSTGKINGPLLQTVERENLDTFKHVSVTLDMETASPWLEVTEDLKSLRWTLTGKLLPITAKRFKNCPGVLGSEGFNSGRRYWEVKVAENRCWNLGVAAQSVERKDWFRLSRMPETGFWTIGWDGNQFHVNSSSRPPIPDGQIPRKVRVCLNYESGTVSFYNVDTKSHLHTFTGNKFTEKLYPFFWTWDVHQFLRICSGVDLEKGQASRWTHHP
ncbi:butyrophilin subfamily 3 member A1-like [Rhincodon typus]|uniref:butyrophilin subfamily 3 member A1-like n=1 Tax=Rhincodon typus TaxID=259920 RepID=UPI00203073B0|nr:butyrophilin subfamily 3 member A1-like [Rhincodon typus]